VISPLLANLYMNRFLKYWRITEEGCLEIVVGFKCHVLTLRGGLACFITGLIGHSCLIARVFRKSAHCP
jgi:hypothetical protein